ncbi:MAG: thioredoxin domain-containing protein [Rickettsiaceae bacterium]|nr:thioredoxin domain-containing protein [Rickettsiaceae bacterium]
MKKKLHILLLIIFFWGVLKTSAFSSEESAEKLDILRESYKQTKNNIQLADDFGQSKSSISKNLCMIHENDLVEGANDSRVVLVEYFSLSCPTCAYFHKNVYPKILKKYIETGQITYISREFINSKQDFDASILSRCAGPMKRKLFHNLLLERQSAWAYNRNYKQILTNIGQIGGISRDQFEKCLNNKLLEEQIFNQSKLVTLHKEFTGTPTIIINNKFIKGSVSFENLSKEIDSLLN